MKTGAAAATGAFVLPRFSIGQPGPSANSKLNVAMIGAGGFASMAYPSLATENIVALCDVDSNKMFQHAEKYPQLRNARTFSDFRVMLDKLGRELDAVVVFTPDHTHFAATMAAMERGLHVFTQKPLTHNIWDARTLRRAKEKYKVVTNMGNQGHTYDGIRQMREWQEADILGQVAEVHSWQGGGGWGFPAGFQPQEAPVPATLDWDLWLGPTKQIPYYPRIHPGSWRRWQAYGSGMLGDWFPHVADGPVTTLELFEPTVIEAELTEEGSEWLTPRNLRVRWDFPARGEKAPCSFYWHNGEGDPNPHQPAKPEQWTWEDELPRGGSLFIGEKNTAYADQRSNNPRLINKEDMKAFKEAGFPAEKYPRVKGGPYLEWMRAIKGEGPEPGSNFDFASRFTEVQLLGVLAGRFGGRIEWDAKEMKITNRPELNEFIKDPVREGWSYGEDLWT
jgi:predicted dehydrogenase